MNKEDEESVPVLKRWSRWYWLVIIVELAQIVVFCFLTKYFA